MSEMKLSAADYEEAVVQMLKQAEKDGHEYGRPAQKVCIDVAQVYATLAVAAATIEAGRPELNIQMVGKEDPT